ncbi:MAG: bifunctional diaminohydroxyphosphoribosylaminopyrimidine deaminase/5-amino-6-(5-phosphoribosylamino)uracil reductase RibD, partial [Fibrobacter sp.]|nr:bifunctional diaminohydroxyphosphoribosylaminopyrimidine deaminase/5-amino-6-(5-phosphoribosylamino)uracil reductase RibD [Fibrobacter sp.]
MGAEITNFMAFALEQAFFSIGVSRPNPAVGAVVVKDGFVVGKGRTQCPGSAHAEVMALRDAGELAQGASIFVTLEPCCHYGRTPPCTKAIIEAGIKKVFFAHSDPNPVVHGKSRAILEAAGIEVHEGLDACVSACVEGFSNGDS